MKIEIAKEKISPSYRELWGMVTGETASIDDVLWSPDRCRELYGNLSEKERSRYKAFLSERGQSVERLLNGGDVTAELDKQQLSTTLKTIRFIKHMIAETERPQ